MVKNKFNDIIISSEKTNKILFNKIFDANSNIIIEDRLNNIANLIYKKVDCISLPEIINHKTIKDYDYLQIPYLGNQIAIIFNNTDINQLILTKKQVYDILTGKITNWNQISSKYNDKKITIFYNIKNSSLNFALKKCYNKLPFNIIGNKVFNNYELKQKVINTNGSISFINFSDISKKHKYVHTIKKNDTLSYLAYKYNIKIDKLIKLNNIVNTNKINIGDKLIILNNINFGIAFIKNNNDILTYPEINSWNMYLEQINFNDELLEGINSNPINENTYPFNYFTWIIFDKKKKNKMFKLFNYLLSQEIQKKLIDYGFFPLNDKIKNDIIKKLGDI